uniref:Retrotransposon protein, putative, Ty3-gypsy subclass n=2 Tax=Oryza sativa subsp. japonica TaxID=39947 RepID=Q10IV8_ORYSJ|nr:hypothetical protein [Oryza sativa Japonica Group]ABF96881.1 retrotransposon protein, putative, Ty3-gypsy subclass [Oryza sativa Japonica Group]
MESSGERGGKRKNEEESSGMDFIGAGRSGTTRARPISPATWGRREGRWGRIQNRIPPLSCAGAAGRRGERGRRRGVGAGDAAWARGKRGRWGAAVAVSGVVTGVGGGRLGEDPTGGPHLSATPGEEGGGAAWLGLGLRPTQQGGGEKKERMGRRPIRKGKGKRKRKRRKGFSLELKYCLLNFNWLGRRTSGCDKQAQEGTFISQTKYVKDILKKFEMEDAKPIKTPMPTNGHLDLDENGKCVDQKAIPIRITPAVRLIEKAQPGLANFLGGVEIMVTPYLHGGYISAGYTVGVASSSHRLSAMGFVSGIDDFAFPPGQAFRFGSFNFITNDLSKISLLDSDHVPVPFGIPNSAEAYSKIIYPESASNHSDKIQSTLPRPDEDDGSYPSILMKLPDDLAAVFTTRTSPTRRSRRAPASAPIQSRSREILDYDDFGYHYYLSDLDNFDDSYEDNYTPLFFGVFMADNETEEQRQAREADQDRVRQEAERRRLEEERQRQERRQQGHGKLSTCGPSGLRPILAPRTTPWHDRIMVHPGRYPLVLDLVVHNVKLRRTLIDDGSALNILFAKTLDDMQIPRTELKPSNAPFHGVIPGLSATPLGQITLPVTFGTRENFRTENVCFEVADFETAYHAILGRPALAKFMAVPHYTYMMMKMPGPRGVISLRSDIKQAVTCDKESCEMAQTHETTRPRRDPTGCDHGKRGRSACNQADED